MSLPSNPHVGSGQGIERSGNHQFQVAFRKHHVSIFPVEHFALSVIRSCPSNVERLRVDGAVCRPTASSDCTAPAMKEPQSHSAFPRHLVKCAVRSKDLPGAGIIPPSLFESE